MINDSLKKLIMDELNSTNQTSVDLVCWDKGCRYALVTPGDIES